MPEPTPAFEIRVATVADDAAVAALISEAAPANPKADPVVLAWQYRSEPFGPTVSVVAESAGGLVGHYGVIGVPFELRGSRIRAARGVDIVTAPAHRGRHVFASVAERLLAAAREAGYELILSNPNDASRSTLRRLGWQEAADPLPLVLPLDARELLRAATVPAAALLGGVAGRVAGLRGHPQRPAAGSRTLGELPEDVSRIDAWLRPGSGLVRDACWWRWRYGEHPHHPYRFVEVRRRGRLCGVAVLAERDDDQVGHVVQLLDLAAEDRDAALQLVRASAGWARAAGASALVAAGPRGADPTRQLVASGFWPVPRRLRSRPIHLLAADLTGARPSLGSEAWSFTLGDQDHL